MRESEGLIGRIVVCVPAAFPAHFRDDRTGNCVFCGEKVRFRPHIPTPHSLVCLSCFFVRAEPGEVVQMTEQSARDLARLGFSPGRRIPEC